jgi:N-acetyl-anhydromuramyl-L-alanine amidase AmpD
MRIRTISLIALAVAALIAAIAIIAAPAFAATSAPKPPIVKKYIPYGAKREAETARYNERHYGQHTYVLKNPKVVVLHFTAGADWHSAWNTFANDTQYESTPGLREYPGVSAHFIVRKNGVIVQCVPLRLRARHAIGMNWTAIGIEIVQEVPSGMTGHWADQQILHRTKQMAAVVKLVRYLQGRFQIKTKNVVGHAMANESPFFKELMKNTKNRTGDWIKQDVVEFRSRL